jgi:uncharacterized protein (TIGR02246 family)
MASFTRVLVVVLLACVPAPAFAGPAEEAGAVIDRWAATYNANDVDAIVKLYAPDALLHGTSSPTLNEGSAAIRSYFAVLAGSDNKVTIRERHMVALGDAAAFGVGFYEFVSIQNGQPVPRPSRFTMIVVKRGADWLIIHHHSSALPLPRQ